MGIEHDKDFINYRVAINSFKGDKDTFELSFISEKEQTIEISLVPINCDHMLLFLFEIITDNSLYFYSVFANVENNSGMWSVQNINNGQKSEYSIFSDIKEGSFQRAIFRNSFTIKLSPTSKKEFGLSIYKI